MRTEHKQTDTQTEDQQKNNTQTETKQTYNAQTYATLDTTYTGIQ